MSTHSKWQCQLIFLTHVSKLYVHGSKTSVSVQITTSEAAGQQAQERAVRSIRPPNPHRDDSRVPDSIAVDICKTTLRTTSRSGITPSKANQLRSQGVRARRAPTASCRKGSRGARSPPECSSRRAGLGGHQTPLFPARGPCGLYLSLQISQRPNSTTRVPTSRSKFPSITKWRKWSSSSPKMAKKTRYTKVD